MHYNRNSRRAKQSNLLKALSVLTLLLIWFGCQRDPEIIPKTEVDKGTPLLTEYWEDGDLVLQFNYEDTLLIRQLQHERQGLLDFKLEYNNFNYKPHRMAAEFENRILHLEFDYNSRGQVQGYTYFVDRYVRYVIRLHYNEKGEIVELRKYWPLNGELIKRKFDWNRGNVVLIEQSSNYIEPSNALIAEYFYDEKSNPFNPLFEIIGFNIIEEVPLTLNNPVEIKKYWKRSPSINELSKIKYAYGRDGFPFVKEVTRKDTRGVTKIIYGEYKY